MGLPPLAPEASASAIPPHPHHLEIIFSAPAPYISNEVRNGTGYTNSAIWAKCHEHNDDVYPTLLQ